MKSVYDIIVKPVITEASNEDMQNRKYTFKVAKDANKVEIKNAVEKIFPGVVVEKVTTISVKGKAKKMGYHSGTTSAWKKAIVKLAPESKTIEFFDSLM
jgi:large subunit ribosomal protein L23